MRRTVANNVVANTDKLILFLSTMLVVVLLWCLLLLRWLFLLLLRRLLLFGHDFGHHVQRMMRRKLVPRFDHGFASGFDLFLRRFERDLSSFFRFGCFELLFAGLGLFFGGELGRVLFLGRALLAGSLNGRLVGLMCHCRLDFHLGCLARRA